jgi:hypothetical protein
MIAATEPENQRIIPPHQMHIDRIAGFAAAE